MTPLANLIREARESKGWTQDDLAEATGTSRGWIGQLESGLIKRPRPPYMEKLERALGLTREELLRATGVLGASVSVDILAEIRRIARIPDLDDRMAELDVLPVELRQLLESMAMDHVRQTFRRAPASSEPAIEAGL